MEDEIIDVESVEVLDEPVSDFTSSESVAPLKTKQERDFETKKFNALKKLIKQKRKYYKSNLFQVRKLETN